MELFKILVLNVCSFFIRRRMWSWYESRNIINDQSSQYIMNTNVTGKNWINVSWITTLFSFAVKAAGWPTIWFLKGVDFDTILTFAYTDWTSMDINLLVIQRCYGMNNRCIWYGLKRKSIKFSKTEFLMGVFFSESDIEHQRVIKNVHFVWKEVPSIITRNVLSLILDESLTDTLRWS